MASKRDWNDMSDDDSQQDHHHHEDELQEELKDLPQQLPSLNKIVSSPFPQKKQTNDQENLKKLQNCKKKQVWLYVPLFYKDSVNEIDHILRSEIELKKIDQFVKGWNVLTNKQNAKTYIVEGKKQGKFFIKFYFSNKNEDNENRVSSYKNLDNMGKYNDNDNKKVKYVAKSPKSREEKKDLRSPDSFRRKQSQNEFDDSRTPKSPTYKNEQDKKYDDYRPKNINSKPSLNRLDSKGNDSFNDSKGYRQKYASKNSLDQFTPKDIVDDNVAESPRKKYKAKAQQPKKQIIAAQTNQSIKVEKINESQQNEAEEETQAVEQENEASVAEKKPKKKKTKKSQPLRDDNNPFSMLM